MIESRATSRIKLRNDVQQLPLGDGRSVLYAAGSVPMRVGASMSGIWSMLVEGAELDHLETRLRQLYPDAPESSARLAEFLNQLRRSGLLENESADKVSTHRKNKIVLLLNLEPVASVLARAVECIPSCFRAAVAAFTILASLTGMGLLIASPMIPRFLDAFIPFSLPGFAVVLLVAVPLHEIGHALACRLACVRVGFLALQRGHFGLPHLSVQTPEALLVSRRSARIQIAAGGLFFDLLIGGICAWIILSTSRTGAVGTTAAFVFLYCVMALVAGTSPLQRGDGSNLFGAIVNDDSARAAALARNRSQISKSRNIWAFRVASLVHAMLSGALLWTML